MLFLFITALAGGSIMFSCKKNNASGGKGALSVRLNMDEAVKKEGGWSVVVSVEFMNSGKKIFELDKLTACEGGELANNVFVIEGKGGRVEYRGMMVKRGPPGPDGFYRIEPGGRVVNRVRLDRDYAFPQKGGAFSIRFESFNHFSKDAVELKSDTIPFSLKP